MCQKLFFQSRISPKTLTGSLSVLPAREQAL
jgi:hypothetical protein